MKIAKQSKTSKIEWHNAAWTSNSTKGMEKSSWKTVEYKDCKNMEYKWLYKNKHPSLAEQVWKKNVCFSHYSTRRNIVLSGNARHPDATKGEFVVNFLGNGKTRFTDKFRIDTIVIINGLFTFENWQLRMRTKNFWFWELITNHILFFGAVST